MSDGVAGIRWIDIYLDGDHWSALPPPAWVNIIPRLGNMILSFNFVLIFKRNGWITRISAECWQYFLHNSDSITGHIDGRMLPPGAGDTEDYCEMRWRMSLRRSSGYETWVLWPATSHQLISQYAIILDTTTLPMTLTATTAAICHATRKRLPFKSPSATLLQIAMEKLQLNNSLFLICNISHFREQIN